MQQRYAFSLVTQDKTEVLVPADFVDQSDMLSEYVKIQRQNNEETEEFKAEFEMSDEMPRVSANHLELIFEFLRIYQTEKQNEKGANEATIPAEEETESTMPKWAFDLFSKQPKNDLYLAMNVANYFGIGPFVLLGAAFVCFQILQKKPGEVAEYLNMDGAID